MKSIDVIIIVFVVLVILLNLSNYFFKKAKGTNGVKCSGCHTSKNISKSTIYDLYKSDYSCGTKK